MLSSIFQTKQMFIFDQFCKLHLKFFSIDFDPFIDENLIGIELETL